MLKGGYMEVKDNTLNIKFEELKHGMCFVFGSEYYMKIRVTGFDEYTNNNVYEYTGLNLQTGLEEKFRPEVKVRLIKTTLIIE